MRPPISPAGHVPPFVRHPAHKAELKETLTREEQETINEIPAVRADRKQMAVSNFENLFVIETTNASERATTLSNKAIREFARIAKFYSARTALKLNVSDNETVVHKSFRHRTDLPIIKRTIASQLAKDISKQFWQSYVGPV